MFTSLNSFLMFCHLLSRTIDPFSNFSSSLCIDMLTSGLLSDPKRTDMNLEREDRFRRLFGQIRFLEIVRIRTYRSPFAELISIDEAVPAFSSGPTPQFAVKLSTFQPIVLVSTCKACIW